MIYYEFSKFDIALCRRTILRTVPNDLQVEIFLFKQLG